VGPTSLQRSFWGRIALPLLAGSILALLMAGTALASHERPISATPKREALVPYVQGCESAGVHNPPLAGPSCVPPPEVSLYLTMNAPDRPPPHNTPADFGGFVFEKVTCVSAVYPPVTNGDHPPCNANPGDQQDIVVQVGMSRVRCRGTNACAAGALYNGKVFILDGGGMADHDNNGAANDPGSISWGIGWGVQCVGGDCNVVTSYDEAIPGMIKEGRRQVITQAALIVFDGGFDEDLDPAGGGPCPPACQGSDDESAYLGQGLFAP
jgi:hypothetical protein